MAGKSYSLEKIKILHTGDLHLNHPKVPTVTICDRFSNQIFPLLKEIDLLVIAGDTFEALVHMNRTDVITILSFFSDLYRECDEHDVVIRVLEGTGSHDRNQMKIWEHLYKKGGYKNDVRYFDKISLEYIESLDVRIVYIPEDVPYSSSARVIKVIKEMMNKAGWTTTDLIVAHGFMDYTLPPMKHKPKIVFTKKQLSSILHKKGKALFGHVHSPSINGQFSYCGSYERLRHGEEERKGFFIIDRNVAKFVENKEATLFKTMDFSKEDNYDKIMEDFTEFVKTFPDHKISHIRIIHPDINLRRLLQKIANRYPYLKFTHVSNNEDKGITLVDENVNFESENGTVITDENLPTLVVQHLESLGDKSLDTKEVISLLDAL